MQKQKTIAKWLAVVLLLTVAVACYIALNAVIKNQQSNSGNVAGADENVSNPDNQTPAPQPIYTTLPRRAENVGDLKVQHMGGENDESLLDTVYYSDKRLVIFSSLSEQYDVKENGIYIGVLQNDSLIEVKKICSTDEEYVGCSITQRGLLIATATAQNTMLRLFSSALKVIAQNSCQRFEQFVLYTHAASLFAIAYDGEFLYSLSISASLEISKSNFVCDVSGATVKDVIAYGEETLVFVQSANDVKLIIFDKISGFTIQNELINSTFAQVLPIFSNGEQLFFTLSYTLDEAIISCFSADFELNCRREISTTLSALLLPYESGVALFDGAYMNCFCAHLDLLSSTDCETQNLFDGFEFEIINGENDLFWVKKGNALKLCKMQDKNVQVMFECLGDSKSVFLEKQATSLQDGQFEYVLICSATSANDFGYMCFGKRDVFVLYMQTL